LRQQVEEAELPRDPWVAHLEAGVEVDDPVVPMKLAPVDGDRHRCGKKRLCPDPI